jgi:flagellar biosynthesis/type III secretory pathway protein FliH
VALDIVLPISVKRIEKSAATAPEIHDDSRAAGYAAGYEEGKLRGEWEGKREQQKQAARAQGLLKALENLHKEYEALVAEHLPDLIQGALHRVFRKHPFTSEEIANEVTTLLRDMEQAGRLTLECSPADAEELGKRLEQCDAIPSGSNWTLETNDALHGGEFMLKSDLGDVDGRHSSRIRQIHLALENPS